MSVWKTFPPQSNPPQQSERSTRWGSKAKGNCKMLTSRFPCPALVVVLLLLSCWTQSYALPCCKSRRYPTSVRGGWIVECIEALFTDITRSMLSPPGWCASSTTGRCRCPVDDNVLGFGLEGCPRGQRDRIQFLVNYVPRGGNLWSGSWEWFSLGVCWRNSLDSINVMYYKHFFLIGVRF